MHRTPLALAICIAGLASAVPPTAAQAPFVGPNCQGWIVSDAVMGVGASEAATSLGLTVQQAQDFVHAGCAAVTTTTPRCDVGHLEAAEHALARGDQDQYMFHLGALFKCFLGEPPGPPL